MNKIAYNSGVAKGYSDALENKSKAQITPSIIRILLFGNSYVNAWIKGYNDGYTAGKNNR